MTNKNLTFCKKTVFLLYNSTNNTKDSMKNTNNLIKHTNHEN